MGNDFAQIAGAIDPHYNGHYKKKMKVTVDETNDETVYVKSASVIDENIISVKEAAKDFAVYIRPITKLIYYNKYKYIFHIYEKFDKNKSIFTNFPSMVNVKCKKTSDIGPIGNPVCEILRAFKDEDEEEKFYKYILKIEKNELGEIYASELLYYFNYVCGDIKRYWPLDSNTSDSDDSSSKSSSSSSSSYSSYEYTKTTFIKKFKRISLYDFDAERRACVTDFKGTTRGGRELDDWENHSDISDSDTE